MNELKVSDLDIQNKLLFRRGDYNILDCGVRTGKTYWAVNNLTRFTRDNKANRILFLVDTTALKDQIIEQYNENCTDADSLWEPTSNNWFSPYEDKIGVMCYQRLGMEFMKIKYLG